MRLDGNGAEDAVGSAEHEHDMAFRQLQSGRFHSRDLFGQQLFRDILALSSQHFGDFTNVGAAQGFLFEQFQFCHGLFLSH